jgi:hypothetical protein
MKKRDEKLADTRLRLLRVSPRIYHFDMFMKPFRAITIAEDVLTWPQVRKILDTIFSRTIAYQAFEEATTLRKELCSRHIYGVAICNEHDQFSRQRGRTIAKGRLWKHLKRIEKEQ